MAVTKIRKISSWVLLACSIITIVVLGLFFFGGDNEPYKGEIWNPIHVDTLLYWQYILFAITVVATFIFAIWQFVQNFKSSPRSALMGLGVVVLFAAMLLISFSIGDTTKLPIFNPDAQKYNVDFWLKITDMWLYSTYLLVVLVILAIVAGSLKKVLKK